MPLISLVLTPRVGGPVDSWRGGVLYYAEVRAMLCQKCHKNLATVRYAEVVNGKVTNLQLCPECLTKQQESTSAGFQLSGPVSSGRSAPAPRVERRRTKAPRTCKSCGAQLAQVLDSGRVDCSQCYTSFFEELEPILKGLHGHTTHRGKRPQVDDARTSLRASLQTKRTLLRSAVLTENFEDAAQLRDEIRQIEASLGAAEADSRPA